MSLDPPLGLTETDLVDLFFLETVEDTVRTWLLGDGRNYISDIANKLVELNTAPLTADEATIIVPPSPPPNTNPGYNPQLDEPRPRTVTGYLT